MCHRSGGKNTYQNTYDDENTPRVDLPREDAGQNKSTDENVEPLPECTRPRKDGPGGE